MLLSLGEIVSVLMRSPRFKGMPLADLETLVVPAVNAGQYLVVEARAKSDGFVTPVAAALWARVSEDIDRRISQTLDKPVQLAPADWKSGDIPWVIVMAGDPRLLNPALDQLQRATLNGRPLRMAIKGPDGKITAGVFSPAMGQAAAAS